MIYSNILELYSKFVLRYAVLFTNSREFVTTGYNCELCILFMLTILCIIPKCLTKKSRVIKTNSNGYSIMSCSNESCDRIATYGFSRGGVGMYCDEHMRNQMVKAFGCEKFGCRGRVLRGTIMCKKHYAEGA